MSFFLHDLVAGNIATLGDLTANGKCRLMKIADNTATSDQGFPVETREARMDEFWPCNWSIKTERSIDAGERVVGSQTRATLVYEITLLRAIERHAVASLADDRLELRRDPTSTDSITLEIKTVIPQQNGAYLIQAIDTNAA